MVFGSGRVCGLRIVFNPPHHQHVSSLVILTVADFSAAMVLLGGFKRPFNANIHASDFADLTWAGYFYYDQPMAQCQAVLCIAAQASFIKFSLHAVSLYFSPKVCRKAFWMVDLRCSHFSVDELLCVVLIERLINLIWRFGDLKLVTLKWILPFQTVN